MNLQVYRFVFFVLFGINTITVNGQTNAVWPTDGGYVQLNKKSNPHIVQNNNLMNTMGYSICNRKGELVLYGDRHGNHYNKLGKKILNSEKIKSSNPNFGILPIQISEFEYLLFYSFDSTVIKKPTTTRYLKYFYGQVDLRLDNGNGGFLEKINIPILSGSQGKVQYGGTNSIKIVRTNNFKYQIYIALNDKIYSILYENFEFKITDSLSLQPEKYIPENLRNLTNWQHNVDFTISPSNGELILIYQSYLTQITYPIETGSNFVTLENINLDSKSKFDVYNIQSIQIHQFVWSPLSLSSHHKNINYFSDDAFSDSDSFLYFPISSFSNIFQFPDSISSEKRISTYQLSYKTKPMILKEMNNFSIHSNDTFLQLKKGIQGDIWCLLRFYDKDRILMHRLGKIEKPESESPYLSGFTDLPLKGAMRNLDFQYQVPEHIRLTETVMYDCQAHVSFKNNSNPYLAWDSFIWYLSHPSGELDTFVGKEPFFSLDKSGDYGLKVQGISSKDYGYKELYFDTLHIRIPEKPAVAFAVSDTIACRFAPMQYFNQSSYSDVKPGEKVTFHWDFGDGETFNTAQTSPFAHIYKKPGVYSVSLTVSNGYCDSTFLKTNFIRITDAPAPGFNVSATQGCAHFTPNFIDTVSENVTRKEYFFSDENQWIPITSIQFSHTFQYPGTYYTVQRLYGYTGCITQTDTAFFYVSKGLTSADTSNTHWASYATNQRIDLAWPSMDGAVAYALFKTKTDVSFPANAVQIITDTFYSDVVPTPDRYHFAIKAIDSCGNMSSFGRLAQPVFLEGTGSSDNSTALLTFTPYLEWVDTLIQYSPEYLSDHGWISLDVLNSAEPYSDRDFALSGSVEKCYRIRANNSQFESYSNQICIPYSPFILMPTAFSPNGDGLNDHFLPITYGIESLHVKIFNRWGEKITELSKGDAWDGLHAPNGQYLVLFTGKSGNGQHFFLEQSLLLVR